MNIIEAVENNDLKMVSELLKDKNIDVNHLINY